MRRHLGGAAAVAVALTAVGVGSAVAQTGQQAERWIPPHDTIVKVTGNAADGFGIHHYDGSTLYPPTDSEARPSAWSTTPASSGCAARPRSAPGTPTWPT